MVSYKDPSFVYRHRMLTNFNEWISGNPPRPVYYEASIRIVIPSAISYTLALSKADERGMNLAPEVLGASEELLRSPVHMHSRCVRPSLEAMNIFVLT